MNQHIYHIRTIISWFIFNTTCMLLWMHYKQVYTYFCHLVYSTVFLCSSGIVQFLLYEWTVFLGIIQAFSLSNVICKEQIRLKSLSMVTLFSSPNMPESDLLWYFCMSVQCFSKALACFCYDRHAWTFMILTVSFLV